MYLLSTLKNQFKLKVNQYGKLPEFGQNSGDGSGSLSECGTHKELVDAGGIYAQLWFTQAQWYSPQPAAVHS